MREKTAVEWEEYEGNSGDEASYSFQQLAQALSTSGLAAESLSRIAGANKCYSVLRLLLCAWSSDDKLSFVRLSLSD